MIVQTPTPIPTDVWQWIFSNRAWSDFPVVFLLVACFVMAAFGARWFWLDFKHNSQAARKDAAAEAEKDRDWREKQNEKREAAATAQNKLWLDSLASQFVVLREISSSMVELRGDLKDHDERAKSIAQTVIRVDENTRPLPGQVGYERRKE